MYRAMNGCAARGASCTLSSGWAQTALVCLGGQVPGRPVVHLVRRGEGTVFVDYVVDGLLYVDFQLQQ